MSSSYVWQDSFMNICESMTHLYISTCPFASYFNKEVILLIMYYAHSVESYM
jgi:hypothetical protein